MRIRADCGKILLDGGQANILRIRLAGGRVHVHDAFGTEDGSIFHAHRRQGLDGLLALGANWRLFFFNGFLFLKDRDAGVAKWLAMPVSSCFNYW